MTSCVGLCPGFENNGRCDIPFFCSNGTDCHDCNDDITPNVLRITALTFMVIFLLLSLSAARRLCTTDSRLLE